MSSQISDILEAGFDLLSQLQQDDPKTLPTKLFFNGGSFPLLIDEERFSQGEEPGDSGIEMRFNFAGKTNAKLPRDSDRVRLGTNEADALAYTVEVATYHPGSSLGHLLLSKRTG